ncbi:unnamed protein product, partial [Mesorhabditis spiculigera]
MLTLGHHPHHRYMFPKLFLMSFQRLFLHGAIQVVQSAFARPGFGIESEWGSAQAFKIGDDDLGMGYEICNGDDGALQSSEDEWEDSDREQSDTAAAMLEGELLDEPSAARMQQDDETLNTGFVYLAPIRSFKRHSEEIDDNDEESETLIVRKRHRSAPEVGGTATLGPEPAYQAASVKGRGKYVPLSAWSKEEKSAATLLVEDHPNISINELYEWSRRRGHLIKRSSIKAFIGRVKAGQEATRKRGSGRPLSLLDLHKEDLETAVEMNPRISSRQLAAVLGIPRTSAQLMCKQLGYHRYKMVEEELLDLPHGKPTGPGFTIWGGVAGNGKKLPLLLLEQGQTVGGREYRYFLENHIIPTAERLIGHDFIYQHDWAPGHNDSKTHQMLIAKEIRYLDRSE